MSKLQELDNLTGPLVMRQVTLENELIEAKERVLAAVHPEEVGQWHNQVTQISETLHDVKSSLRNIRQQQAGIIRMEIEQIVSDLKQGAPLGVRDKINHLEDLNDSLNRLERSLQNT